LSRAIFLFKQFPLGAPITVVALIAGLFSMVRAFQATQELSRVRESDAQIAAVYGEIRELRHELLLFEASPKDLLIELDRTEEQLQNGHSSVDQTRIKLQSLRNELAESLAASKTKYGKVNESGTLTPLGAVAPRDAANPRSLQAASWGVSVLRTDWPRHHVFSG